MNQLALDMPETKQAYADAREWLTLNPRVWPLLVEWAYRDRAEGRRCAMHFYLHMLRRLSWIQADASGYRVNDHYSRPLVDMLIAAHPDLERSFERRGGGASPL